MNLSKETLELIEKEAGKHQSGTQSWHQTKRNSFRQGAEIALTTPSILASAGLASKNESKESKWDEKTKSGTYTDKVHHGEMKVKYTPPKTITNE